MEYSVSETEHCVTRTLFVTMYWSWFLYNYLYLRILEDTFWQLPTIGNDYSASITIFVSLCRSLFRREIYAITSLSKKTTSSYVHDPNACHLVSDTPCLLILFFFFVTFFCLLFSCELFLFIWVIFTERPPRLEASKS